MSLLACPRMPSCPSPAPNPDRTPPPRDAAEVFQNYSSRIYQQARRMLGNDADAEDITQEVLLQVVRKLDTFRQEADFGTWLHRIVVNAVLAHRRKCARRSERQLPDVPEHVLGETTRPASPRPAPCRPDRAAVDRETRRLIERAMYGLPGSYRTVYVLADVEGLSNPEIGARLGLGLAAVKSRLHRARLMMREALAPHFGEACVG
jgi:RNA polymerase sigma-70 factor (ECF subfamily)